MLSCRRTCKTWLIKCNGSSNNWTNRSYGIVYRALSTNLDKAGTLLFLDKGTLITIIGILSYWIENMSMGKRNSGLLLGGRKGNKISAFCVTADLLKKVSQWTNFLRSPSEDTVEIRDKLQADEW